jgi:pre-mRNA-splicing factor 18
MEALKAEIERKRKLNSDLRSQLSAKDSDPGNADSSSGPGGIQFIRQGDRKKMEELKLAEKQRELDLERSKRTRIEEEKISVPKTSETSKNKTSGTKSVVKEEHYLSLSVLEVKRRLRSLAQPITLFGESVPERVARLVLAVQQRELQGTSRREADNIKVGQNASIDAEEEAALEAEDLADAAASKKAKTAAAPSSSSAHHKQQGTDAAREGSGGPDHRTHTHTHTHTHTQNHGDNSAGGNGNNAQQDGEDDDDEEEEEDNKDGGGGKGTNGVHWDPTVHFSAMKDLPDEKIVYKFFRALAKQWEADLNMREDWEKRTAKGRNETRTQKQCKDSIRPLFRMCKRKEVPYDILVKLVLMVKHCEEGNFLAANDQYIRTAIGNAAWPIGLTMVGIHERSGREKISTSKVCFPHV